MNDITLNAFFDELTRINNETEKTSGIREGLKTLFTGRMPLYHGTSAARASQIAQKGLIPAAAPGVSEAVRLGNINENLAFATLNKRVADVYGKQQTAMDRLGSLREKFPGFVEKLRNNPKMPAKAVGYLDRIKIPTNEKFMENLTQNPVGGYAQLRALGAFPGKNVVRMDVPREYIRNNIRLNPEVTNNPVILNTPRLAANHMSDVVLAGGVPSEFVRSSQNYKRVTLGELKKHFGEAVKNPKALAQDVLRSTTGISTPPQELIQRAELAGIFNRNEMTANALMEELSKMNI